MRKWWLFVLCAALAGAASAQPWREAQKRQEQLGREVESLRREFKNLQRALVDAAERTQKAEAALDEAEAKLTILKEQEQARSAELKNRQESLATLVQAALRLSRTPPEAVVMMPGDARTMATTARALKLTTDSLKKEAESIRGQLTELARLKERVEGKRKDVLERKSALETTRKELEERLKQRKAALIAAGEQETINAQNIRALAKNAENLEALVGGIEKNVKAQAVGEMLPDSRVPTGTRGELRPISKAKGQVRSPLVGLVTRSYGASEGKNQTSRGLSVTGRAAAPVVAPYDAEVVFVGPFLNYGRVAILRHSEGFHSILAGLGLIDVRVGQFLLEGEPIGAMGTTGADRTLYYELRKNNQPIDPRGWIRGLKLK